MLVITNQSDYGILFISYLLNKKDYVPLSEIVKRLNLPSRFLARIAAKLVKNKIIISREGKVGGYKLTKKIEEITVYDYLKIFEGDLLLLKCADIRYRCLWERLCFHKKFFQQTLRKNLIAALSQYKLKDIFNNFKNNYAID